MRQTALHPPQLMELFMSAPLRTNAQNRQIRALVGQLGALSGLSKDETDPILREACRAVSGQTHTTALTVDQARRVIGRLTAETAKYQKPGQPQPGRPTPRPHEPWGDRQDAARQEAVVTKLQVELIATGFRVLGWDTQRSRAFVMRQCKHPWPQTQADADAVYEAQKAMVARTTDWPAVWRRVAAIDGSRLNEWQQGFLADIRGKSRGGTGHLSIAQLDKLAECEAVASEAA